MMKGYMKECNKEKHLKIKLEEAVEASEAEVSSLRDKVAELDRLCDEVGLDTIETGAALGVLMDAGGMEGRLHTFARSVPPA